MTEPLRGGRQVTVSQQRTRLDFAHVVKELVDRYYPEAERIVLVCDQLNTHAPASLYAALPPQEARRLVEKLEWHHTSRHGSWLNMVGLELSVLARQCLARRLPTLAVVAAEVAAWEAARNAAQATVKW